MMSAPPQSKPARPLPVYEMFHTWQGEGVHMGRAAFFIRTFGCPVHCPWCDSAGTWHPDHVPETIDKLPVPDLVAAAVAARPDFVVITGGEPAIHDLRPLTRALREAGLPSHLETSGAFPLRGEFAWITVSPKIWKKPLPDVLAQADELKLIIDQPGATDFWIQELGEPLIQRIPHIWLHPEWSVAGNREILQEITQTVKDRGAPFRAGYQLHKVYLADEMDERSRNSGSGVSQQ